MVKELFVKVKIDGERVYSVPKTISFTFESLKIELIKSVTSISEGTMQELQQALNACSYALTYLTFKPKWIERCFFRLEVIYTKAIAEDRMKIDQRLLDQLTEAIKYIANVNRQIAHYEARLKKYKEEEIE